MPNTNIPFQPETLDELAQSQNANENLFRALAGNGGNLPPVPQPEGSKPQGFAEGLKGLIGDFLLNLGAGFSAGGGIRGAGAAIGAPEQRRLQGIQEQFTGQQATDLSELRRSQTQENLARAFALRSPQAEGARSVGGSLAIPDPNSPGGFRFLTPPQKETQPTQAGLLSELADLMANPKRSQVETARMKALKSVLEDDGSGDDIFTFTYNADNPDAPGGLKTIVQFNKKTGEIQETPVANVAPTARTTFSTRALAFIKREGRMPTEAEQDAMDANETRAKGAARLGLEEDELSLAADGYADRIARGEIRGIPNVPLMLKSLVIKKLGDRLILPAKFKEQLVTLSQAELILEQLESQIDILLEDPTNVKAIVNLRALRNSTAGVFAKGVFKEVGVLTDLDISRAKEMTPGFMSVLFAERVEPGLAKSRLGVFKKLINESRDLYLREQFRTFRREDLKGGNNSGGGQNPGTAEALRKKLGLN